MTPIVAFARAPEPGKVKTRLAGADGRVARWSPHVTRTSTRKAHVRVMPERAALVRHMFERYASGEVLGRTPDEALPRTSAEARFWLPQPQVQGRQPLTVGVGPWLRQRVRPTPTVRGSRKRAARGVLAPVAQCRVLVARQQEVSLNALSDELFELGLRTKSGKPIGGQRVKTLLRHPMYIGDVYYHGRTRPGRHEAIVARPLFDQVQAVLAHRSVATGEKGSKFFLLRGMLFCAECGRQMTAEDHARGSYYRCMPDVTGKKCTASYVPVKALNAEVQAVLPEVQLTEQGKAEVRESLDQLAAEQARTRDEELHQLQTKRTSLQGRRLKLTEGFATGIVPVDQYEALEPQLRQELAAVDERIAFLDQDLSEDIAAVETILETATAVAHFYALAPTPEQKKEHLRRIFKRIEVKDRHIHNIEYHPPFHLLLGATDVQAVSEGSLEHRLLEYLANRTE